MRTPEAPRRAMKLAECAELLGVSADYLKRTCIDTGKLPVFVPPGGEAVSSRRGPKTLRVWSDDWDRFTRSRTKVVDLGQPAPAEKIRPATVGPAGLDGKRRGKTARARR